MMAIANPQRTIHKIWATENTRDEVMAALADAYALQPLRQVVHTLAHPLVGFRLPGLEEVPHDAVPALGRRCIDKLAQVRWQGARLDIRQSRRDILQV